MSKERSETEADVIGDYLPVLKNACEEGRETLDQQVEWIRQIDQKAIRVLRANILLLGLLLTGFSILIQADTFDAEPYFNFYIGLAFVALLGSMAFAAITYLSSQFEGGIKASEIKFITGKKHDEIQWYRGLSLGYANWIEYNSLVINFNATLCTITILLVIDAVTLFTAGLLVGGLEIDGEPVSYTFLFVLLVHLSILNYFILRIDNYLGVYYDSTQNT